MKSPLTWIGGKRMSAKRIVARMPAHKCYCEVFAGAGASNADGTAACMALRQVIPMFL
jgi:site-specific DNA-adenine methylase